MKKTKFKYESGTFSLSGRRQVSGYYPQIYDDANNHLLVGSSLEKFARVMMWVFLPISLPIFFIVSLIYLLDPRSLIDLDDVWIIFKAAYFGVES